jgi:hypothetical protein
MRGKRNIQDVLMEKPEGALTVGTPRRGRVIILKWAWGTMDWINLAQNRDQCKELVNTVTDLQVLKVKVKVTLRLTASQYILISDILISGSHDQMFVTVDDCCCVFEGRPL